MNMITNDEKSWRVRAAEAMRYGTALLGVPHLNLMVLL